MQSKANAQALLDKILVAMDRIAEGGKAATFATENGTRVVTEADLPQLRDEVTRLTRIVTSNGRDQHNFAVASFNNSR